MIKISEYPGGLDGIRKALAEQQAPGARWAGKATTFARAAMIDAGQHRNLILMRIGEIYTTEEAKRAIEKHVSRDRNVLRYIVDSLATPYNTAPTRKIRDITDAQAEAIRDAYRIAEVDEALEQAGRIVVWGNTAHVLVRWEQDEPRMLVLGPHQCDALWAPGSGDKYPSILTYATSAGGADRVLVDSERWVWVRESAGQWTEIESEPHGLGMTPWVCWRWRAPASDYWDVELGQDLVDCTLDVGRMAAHMRWVRTHRAQRALVLTLAENDPTPAPQQVNGDGAIMIRGSRAAGLEVIDPETPPHNFLTDIKEAIASTAASYGLRSVSDAGLVDEEAEADKLGKLRARQLSHFARAELELARRIAALVSRHDPARAVADEAVRKGFRVRFAPFVPADDPRAQVETALAQQKVAATNPVAFYQQLHPELDEYAAETEVYENVEQLAKMADALASRNLALGDSNQLQTVAQLQGRVGGQASGATRAEQSDNERDPDTLDE